MTFQIKQFYVIAFNIQTVYKMRVIKKYQNSLG